MTTLNRFLSRLKGKTAWVSGGKRIGRVVARALAEQGVNIIASYRASEAEAQALAGEVRKLGVRSLVVQADASKPSEVERAVRQMTRTFKKIDILVNMASVFDRLSWEEVTPEIWESNIDAHILGAFWPIRHAAPHMPRGSHIVNIADRTSIGKVYRNYLPYVVTKQAVQGLTRALAVELAPKGIFVNCIAPGPILPPETTSRKEWKALRESSRIKFPIDDREAMEQFALLVLYLSLVTMTSGNTYPLDQGQNL